MSDNREIFKVALRVLTSLYDPRGPETRDVETLKRHAPSLANAPLDDLAREIITGEMRGGAQWPKLQLVPEWSKREQ